MTPHKCVITFGKIAWTAGLSITVMGGMWITLYTIMLRPVTVNANDITVLDKRDWKFAQDISNMSQATIKIAEKVKNLQDNVDELRRAVNRIEDKLNDDATKV